VGVYYVRAQARPGSHLEDLEIRIVTTLDVDAGESKSVRRSPCPSDRLHQPGVDVVESVREAKAWYG